jgi:hypothetical protein
MKSNFGTTHLTLFELVPEIGTELGRVDSVIQEDFPHIAKQVTLFWGTVECLDFLESLINWHPEHDRPQRQGFPFYAIQEIAIITAVHKKKFPHLYTERRRSNEDVWGGAPDRGRDET